MVSGIVDTYSSERSFRLIGHYISCAVLFSEYEDLLLLGIIDHIRHVCDVFDK